MNLENNNNGKNGSKKALNKLNGEDLKTYSSRPDYCKSQKELIEELRVKTQALRFFEDEQGQKKSSSRKITIKRKLVHAVYLSIILLIGLSVYTVHDLNTVSEKETFEKYYNNFSESKTEINYLKDFFNENYSFVPDNLPDSIFVNGKFLKALSFIEEMEYKKAAQTLKNINSNDAKWLEALCYLRIKEHKKAKLLFEEISSSRSLFSFEADEILKTHYYNYHSK